MRCVRSAGIPLCLCHVHSGALLGRQFSAGRKVGLTRETLNPRILTLSFSLAQFSASRRTARVSAFAFIRPASFIPIVSPFPGVSVYLGSTYRDRTWIGFMNREKLIKMAGAVRTGGKGSMRRKKKAVHKSPTTDDKKLQSTLRRIGVNTIPAIEEVNIFKDDAVIQFLNPKVQASIAANTWVVSGVPQTKKLQDILPTIINQLGPDNLENLRKLAEQFQRQAPEAAAAAADKGGEEEDGDVPDLVPGETFEQAAEEKQAS
ncbi:hypothetical protein ZIOFF_032721 [Zingiber officinale]|uniref:Nascent polypeptide-associated complex subunit beta n=2 Tax=Zingiber officinale TaxID=94328 RepID=A0A8J5L1F5_ZINOF|nr:hypothetical protein ZIOFF_032721 [Zingiber officinale]